MRSSAVKLTTVWRPPPATQANKHQGCHGQGKTKIFKVREKSGNFAKSQRKYQFLRSKFHFATRFCEDHNLYSFECVQMQGFWSVVLKEEKSEEACVVCQTPYMAWEIQLKQLRRNNCVLS